MINTRWAWVVGSIAAAGAIMLSGCGTTAYNAQANLDDASDIEPYMWSLSVSRHAEQPFSTDRVDIVFSEATALLYSDDNRCPDVACPVTFTRDGAVNTFDFGDSILSTEAQLDVVFEEPEDFKIVTMMLGVCGTARPGSVAVVLGCAYRGGSVVIAEGADPDVWAHEWGHVQGLNHRDDCESNVMHSYELNTDAVSATECRAFATPTPSSGLFRKATAVAEPEYADLDPRPDESHRRWLERVTAHRYLSGIPEDVIVRNGDAETANLLLELLANSEAEQVRGNIARALGFAANPAAVPVLIGQLTDANGDVSPAALGAYAEMILALGRLVDVDPTDTAIDFLLAGINADFWPGLRLVSDDVVIGEGDAALARVCITALGLTAHPAALSRLTALQESLAESRVQTTWLSAQVDEALLRFAGEPIESEFGPKGCVHE